MKNITRLFAAFLIFCDGFIVGVFGYLFGSEWIRTGKLDIILLIFFLIIFGFLTLFNYFFFKYRFNYITKIEYSEDLIIFYYKKQVKKIPIKSIYSIKISKFLGRGVINSTYGKYYIQTNKPFKTENFDYEYLKTIAKK